MIKYQKPQAFYDTFERKGPGEKSTTYCPGCGHGTIHKIIAGCIDELGIQNRVIFLSPVGCSVFAYYYFDTGNIQCSHGRAPAVATGIRRTLRDAIIISYQGDGDLAGIGTTEIIHAANRGENITVFFVNNAIYGMTGGQMAPTTLVGQKTLTTPTGRSLAVDGEPIGMAEIMNAIKAPIFIERVSLATPAKVLKTRKACFQALKNQIDNKGFSFVEILSPCPINWKMNPTEARIWIEKTLEPVFPVKNFRDNTDKPGHTPEVPPVLSDEQLIKLFQVDKDLQKKQHSIVHEDQFIKIAGFGGQGVMSAGVLLANCATAEGLNASWLPSYGPEMRGGTANASVIVSKNVIGSPIVDDPNVLIAMNAPSLDTFENQVLKNGLIIVNSSIIQQKVVRDDVRVLYVPASDMASEEGLLAAATIIMLSVYILKTGLIDIETVKAIIPMSIKNKKFIDMNLRIVQRAIAFYEDHKKSL